MATLKTGLRAAQYVAWISSTLTFVCTQVYADTQANGLNYSIGVSLEHSDNINETSIDPVGQDLLIPQLNFGWTEQGSDLQAQVNGQIQYRDYLQGSFDNELRGQVSGVANWVILPQRLSIDFEDYAANEPANVLATNAPGNQQQTNIFTLGPTLQFRLGAPLRGEADLRITNTTASVDKEFNSERANVVVRAIRDLNSTDTLSANVSAENVHFTNTSGGPGYDSDSAFARYVSKLSQVDVDIAAGYTTLNYSGGPSQSGPLVRADAVWRATPDSTVELNYVHQYSDAAQDLVLAPPTLAWQLAVGPSITGTIPITSQVYLENGVTGTYTFSTPRFKLGISPYYRDLNYGVVPLIDQLNIGATDQRVHGATLGAQYRLLPTWTLGGFAHEETRNYTQIAQRDEDLNAGLNLNNQMSTHWSWRADWIWNKRASTGQALIAAQTYSFVEHIAMITLTYTR